MTLPVWRKAASDSDGVKLSSGNAKLVKGVFEYTDSN